MITKWTIIVFTCTLIAVSESAFVDSLSKCDIDNTSCQRDLIQRVLKDIAKTGIEDYNILPFDPIELKGLKIPIPGILNITVQEGEARGIKDCIINNVITDYKEEGRLVTSLTCDLDIKAKVKLEDISPLIQNTLKTNALEGGGNAKIKLNKLNVKFEVFFEIVKKDDGEIYFKGKPEKIRYEYDIDDAKFVTDKILLGEQDASDTINQFFDKNWKFIFKTVGKNFFDVAMGILGDILQAIFDRTPAKFFITNDLSSYVKDV